MRARPCAMTTAGPMQRGVKRHRRARSLTRACRIASTPAGGPQRRKGSIHHSPPPLSLSLSLSLFLFRGVYDIQIVCVCARARVCSGWGHQEQKKQSLRGSPAPPGEGLCEDGGIQGDRLTSVHCCARVCACVRGYECAPTPLRV